MLGQILSGLTNASAAEDILSFVADEALLARVRSQAAAQGVTPGDFVAASVRHLLDHGGDDVWVDLIGKMSNTPRPGAAAVTAILAQAFRAAPHLEAR